MTLETTRAGKAALRLATALGWAERSHPRVTAYCRSLLRVSEAKNESGKENVSLAPICAVDLGAAPAAVMVAGTWDVPFLLAARRFSRWGPELLAQLGEWKERFPNLEPWCESTFSGPKWNRDTGRKQEAQATDVAAVLGMLYRVPPCTAEEAHIAWDHFGKPKEGGGPAGEHLRDAYAISLKAILRSRSGKPLWEFTSSYLAAQKRPTRGKRNARR